MFMFIVNILGHNLLGTNRQEGWVRTDRSGYERSKPGYESSGHERWVKPLSMFHVQVFSNYIDK